MHRENHLLTDVIESLVNFLRTTKGTFSQGIKSFAEWLVNRGD